MKKKASEIKNGETLIIGGDKVIVQEIELSDVGKQGTKKCRIVARKQNGENVVIIRPADYPLEAE